MKIVNIKIEQLKPAKYNPRLDLQPEDKEYQDIKRSIVEFGLVEPLVINKDMTVIGGHQRLKVLRDLNHTMIPCIIVDLDKQKEKMLNIALNKISGDWDRNKLKDILEELDTGEFDVSLTGFGEQEIEDLMTEFHVEPEEDDFDVDKAVEEIGEPICKRGDLWQLGEHRLMCGDATVEADVKRLMDGKKADMIFTDPPYGLGGYGGRKKMQLIGDDSKNIKQYYDCIPLDVPEIYIWGNYKNLMYHLKKEPRDVIVWRKNNFGLGNGYRGQYELIFYYGNFSGSDSDVWDISKDTNYEHPTQKPVALAVRAMNNSSKKGMIVLDLFGGSGSTLIAAQQLGRRCYMSEISELYCDVIIKRFEQYTNKKAVKIN